MNLRQFARGQDCQVRIYGVCNYNPETTVLAHIRLGGVAGMGQKPPDFPGCFVFACSNCHDAIDKRIKTDLTQVQLESHILHAVTRTSRIVAEHYDLQKK
jgi:hypothetical protein